MSVELLSSYLTSYNTLFLRTQIKSAKSHVQDWRGRCQRGRRVPPRCSSPQSLFLRSLCARVLRAFRRQTWTHAQCRQRKGPPLPGSKVHPQRGCPRPATGAPHLGKGRNKASHLTIAPVGQHGASKAATHPAAPGRPCVHL